MLRLVLLAFLSVVLLAQSGAPALDPTYALDAYVAGQAASDSGPVTVYDISYPARTKIGKGTVDKNGKFAVSVKPPLKQGNRLIVEDRLKRVSASVVVQAPRIGPVPRPGQ